MTRKIVMSDGHGGLVEKYIDCGTATHADRQDPRSIKPALAIATPAPSGLGHQTGCGRKRSIR